MQTGKIFVESQDLTSFGLAWYRAFVGLLLIPVGIFSSPASGAAVHDADAVSSGTESDAVAGGVSSGFLDRLELRSVVALPGGYLFSLRDPDTDAAFWIDIGGRRHGVQAIAFDADRNILTIRHGDAVRELRLSSARVRSEEEIPEQIPHDELMRMEVTVDSLLREVEVQEFLAEYLEGRLDSANLELLAAIGDDLELRRLEDRRRAMMDGMLAAVDPTASADEFREGLEQIDRSVLERLDSSATFGASRRQLIRATYASRNELFERQYEQREVYLRRLAEIDGLLRGYEAELEHGR